MHLQVMLGNKATTHEDYVTGFQHAHICSVSQQVSICLIYVYVMLNKMLEENKKIFKTEFNEYEGNFLLLFSIFMAIFNLKDWDSDYKSAGTY